MRCTQCLLMHAADDYTRRVFMKFYPSMYGTMRVAMSFIMSHDLTVHAVHVSIRMC